MKWIKEKKKMDFIDLAVKEKKSVPSPDTYKINRTILQDEKGRKGSFSKMPKLTYIDSIIKEKPKAPDPGIYNLSVKEKLKGNFKWHEQRVGYIEEC